MNQFKLTAPMQSRPGSRLVLRSHSITLLFAVFCLLPSTNSSSCPQKHSVEPPKASIDCKRNPDDNSDYLCVVVAQCPDGCPQYKWAVPDGKIVGDPTTANIRVDTRQVEKDTLVVSCRGKGK